MVTENDKPKNSVKPRVARENQENKLPTMVDVSTVPVNSTGNNNNGGILPIFKMLIDKLNELEPGQQHELKTLLNVKTETNNSS